MAIVTDERPVVIVAETVHRARSIMHWIADNYKHFFVPPHLCTPEKFRSIALGYYDFVVISENKNYYFEPYGHVEPYVKVLSKNWFIVGDKRFVW